MACVADGVSPHPSWHTSGSLKEDHLKGKVRCR